MGNIAKPNNFSANTTISSSQVNDNFDTIYNDYNGSIDANNLATGAVTAAKIADSNVTTAKIADANVTTAKINNSSVTSSKIDFGGAGAGVWWEEIGRTTLGSGADTISVTSFTAKKHLKILVFGIATGGTINMLGRFNNDSANNYANRTSSNGAADSAGTSQSGITISSTGASAYPAFAELDVINVLAQEKMVRFVSLAQNAAGAANAPVREEGVSKWANTAAQVTRVDVINSAGTGDFATGSELVILGHD